MTRSQSSLLRHWKTAFCLAALLLAGGCARNVQKTGNLSEPKDRPLSVDWKYLRWPLNDVFFVDTKHGWGVAKSGLVLATQDGGLTWERRESGTQSDLEAVWFVNDRVGWSVGDQVILSTRDGGLTWTSRSDTSHLNDVHFINERKGWAVGHEGAIRATTDGGKSWDPQDAQTTTYLTAIQFVDADMGWAVGGGGTIIATRDGGRHWISQVLSDHSDLGPVFFLDKNHGWISRRTGILQTRDGGRQWRSLDSLDSFSSLQFTDELHGFAIVEGSSTYYRSRHLFSTDDGGISWTDVALLRHYDYFREFAGFGEHYSSGLRFIDKRHGYIFDHGSVSWTADDGRTWTRHWEGYPSNAFHFIDTKHGWGLSRDRLLLFTSDGGVSWSRTSRNGQKFRDVYFLNLDTGWAVTDHGALVSTTNGGLSWESLGKIDISLNAIHFVDPQTGWAVGKQGAIIKTEDGGRQWTSQQSDLPRSISLLDCVFVDREHGWAAGEGIIVATSNGGKTWTKQMGPRADTLLNGLAFANASTGWSVGYRSSTFSEFGSLQRESLILMTQDGGKTWIEDARVPRYLSEIGGIAFNPAGHIRIAALATPIEESSFMIEGKITDHTPWVRDFQVEDQLDGNVLVSLHARDERPASVQLTKLEFLRPGPDAQWGTIQQNETSEASSDGLLTVSWNPGEYQFDDGDLITYRVTLSDDAGLSFTQEIRKQFTYRSKWNQPAVQGATVGGGFLISYAALCLALLWLSPLALLWVHQHVPLQGLVEQVPGKGWGLLVSLLLNATGLPALARHPRTRRAWEARYRAGHTKFSDLPPGLRASYVEDPGCLDAWVARRATAAKEALVRIEAVHKRSVYIELPVRDEERQLLPEPMTPRLRELFARERTVLAILGEGGAGKSTLACQIARWAIADDPASRFSDHRMIPIFLEEETTDLVASATGQLRSMVGTEETDPDIVLSLLRSKRLLIVMDALSECTLETQNHVEKVHQTAPVNALIVTARRSPDFGPVPVTKLWPLKITPPKLVYFLVEYLRRTGNDDLFPDRKGLQLADRLLAVVERGGQGVEVTPLLVKLFVDQAIKLRRAGQSLEQLPTSIAETMLDSLRHTNPDNPEMPNRVDNPTLILAARVLGRCSLDHDFVPRDFERRRAEAELVREKIQPEKVDVIARLIDNGVLQERSPGGTSFLRFTLDPLAEYLAAIDWLATHGSNKEAWQEWLTRLRDTEGYPEQVRGFLVAFQNCLQTYRDVFKVPDLDFEDEELRGKRPLL